MKYRSRTDIVFKMLESANGGCTKTRIMYNAYISYSQLKDYLSTLIENGLIEHDAASNTYRTTPKGIDFMNAYQKMDDMSNFTSKLALLQK